MRSSSWIRPPRAQTLDVTGVKLAGGDVAGMLLGTATALRLLGAQAVITGIRPDMAQTLVAQEIDLGAIVTRATLQSGIAYALGRDGGRAVTPSGAPPLSDPGGPRGRRGRGPGRGG